MIDEICTLEYHSYSRFVGFHLVYRTIALCDGRVILKLIYLVFISMGDTSNKLSGAAGIEMDDPIHTSKSVLCIFYRFHKCFSYHNVVEMLSYIEVDVF